MRRPDYIRLISVGRGEGSPFIGEFVFAVPTGPLIDPSQGVGHAVRPATNLLTISGLVAHLQRIIGGFT